MQLSREQIEAVYQQGLDAVVALVGEFQQQQSHLQLYVAALENRLADLEVQLKQNSSNSSKPPSSDIERKAKGKPPRREPQQRRKGGQPGHPGHTLEMVATPDVVVEHTPMQCPCCGADLRQAEASASLKRQVFDLPPISLEVTEHRGIEKQCAFCGRHTWGSFPAEVVAPVQYGPRLKALVLYLSTYQLLPYERLSQVIFDMTGQAISTGTLAEMVARGSQAVVPCCQEIKQEVAASAVVHADETGMFVNGKSYWMHVASTAAQTIYGLSPKRGKDGMDVLDVLPHVRGTMVHDGLASYQQYEACQHALCNAHHLRELKALEEQGVKWVKRMRKLLLEMKEAVDAARALGQGKPEEAVVAAFLERYDQEIARVKKELGPVPKEMVRRERGDGVVEIIFRPVRKKSKSYNLLLRLDTRRDQVLRFLTQEWVPFDNNQAERDLRMGKLKQKISGCFRSEAGGEAFCRLRSYISTMKKQGKAVLGALQAAVEGHPLSCTPS